MALNKCMRNSRNGKGQNPRLDLKTGSCATVPRIIPNIVGPKQCVPKATMYYTDSKTSQILGIFGAK